MIRTRKRLNQETAGRQALGLGRRRNAPLGLIGGLRSRSRRWPQRAIGQTLWRPPGSRGGCWQIMAVRFWLF